MQRPAGRVRVRFWFGYFGAWLALGLWQGLNTIIGYRNYGRPIPAWEPLSWELSSVALVSLLAIGIYRFEARRPLVRGNLRARLPLHLAAAVAFSLLHTIGMVALRVAVYAGHGRRYDFGDWRLGVAYEFQKDLVTYALIVGACMAWRVWRERRERALAQVRLERDLAAARLAQLTAQIEPHFVFNTLNAISNRMHEDVDAADRMIAAFADLLRAALAGSGRTEVRVADDVAWLERYFELIGERYRGQLETRIAVDEAASAAYIPRLLLQPLVENAFEHGLRAGRGRIDVSVRRDGERLRLVVEDDGPGFRADLAEGIGLANVRGRLALIHPDAHAFRLGAREGGGARVEIELPVRDDG